MISKTQSLYQNPTGGGRETRLQDD